MSNKIDFNSFQLKSINLNENGTKEARKKESRKRGRFKKPPVQKVLISGVPKEMYIQNSTPKISLEIFF